MDTTVASTTPETGPDAETHVEPDDSAVRLAGVTKRFGNVVAVDDLDLTVREGEFFSLLGPSGSGKTTCLRLIAGFERPNAGTIFLHGTDVTRVPPYDRDVNTVFQDYALFPHMDVRDNVAYGLMVKRVGKAERANRVDEALAMVHLDQHGDRRPNQLSGGQRQRVALARALVNRPEVLLLDEPLGALDLKLRQAMQLELKSIQREVGITFLYVTHDQEEALTMSDRLAVFNDGRIAQIGTPAEVYESPLTSFVAGFVGVSNILRGDLATRSGSEGGHPRTLRPERIRIAAPDAPTVADEVAVDGVVRDAVFLGAQTRYLVEVGDGVDLAVVVQNLDTSSVEALAAKGRRVRLAWKAAATRPLSLEMEALEMQEEESGADGPTDEGGNE